MTIRFWAAMVAVTVILGALAVRAQTPPQTPCEVELQIVQGGRTQAEKTAATLYTQVQEAHKRITALEAAAATATKKAEAPKAEEKK